MAEKKVTFEDLVASADLTVNKEMAAVVNEINAEARKERASLIKEHANRILRLINVELDSMRARRREMDRLDVKSKKRMDAMKQLGQKLIEGDQEVIDEFEKRFSEVRSI